MDRPVLGSASQAIKRTTKTSDGPRDGGGQALGGSMTMKPSSTDDRRWASAATASPMALTVATTAKDGTVVSECAGVAREAERFPDC